MSSGSSFSRRAIRSCCAFWSCSNSGLDDCLHVRAVAGEKRLQALFAESTQDGGGFLKYRDQRFADLLVLRGSEAVEDRGQRERIGLRQMFACDLEELLSVGVDRPMMRAAVWRMTASDCGDKRRVKKCVLVRQ